MEMLLAGEWRGAGDGATEMVRSPYDGRPAGSVPVATIDDAAAAIDDAEAAARVQRETPAHERVAVLLRAADLADQRAEDIAQTISAETGKPISEARGEASRSGAIIRLAAHEGSQLYGSTLPLDANPGTGLEKIGFTRAPAVRDRRGDHPVQLPRAAGAAQDRPGVWPQVTRSCSNRPARHR